MSETSLALALGATLVAPVMLVALLLELRAPAGPVEEPAEVPAIEVPVVEESAQQPDVDALDSLSPEQPPAETARIGSMLATSWS